MNKILRGICCLPALLFIFMGIQWAIDPAAAEGLGMTLMAGKGLSTQMGDVGSFFLAGGIITALGVITLEKTWFYAAALLVALAAVFRLLSTAYGAELVLEAIILEALLTALFLFAASRIKPQTSNNGE